MRTALAFAMLIGALGSAQAEPAAKKNATPAPVVKTPPLPPQLDETMFADAASAKWASVATLPKGAQGALIGTDASNGGMAGWLKLPAGYHLPASWETHISTYTIVSGQITLTNNGQKHTLGPGGYAVLTSRDKHQLVCGSAECLLVVRHHGPPDTHWVNPADAPAAR